MADVRLSSRAESDLAAIADYTIETFGVGLARRYRDALDDCFRRLAGNPRLGRSAEQIAPGLRRLSTGRTSSSIPRGRAGF